MGYEDFSLIRQIEDDLANDKSFNNIPPVDDSVNKLRSEGKSPDLGVRKKLVDSANSLHNEGMFPSDLMRREMADRELAKRIVGGQRVVLPDVVVDDLAVIRRDSACGVFNGDSDKLMACRRGFVRGVAFERELSGGVDESDFEEFRDLESKD